VQGQTEWDLVPQTDFSDLHQHLNVCNPTPNDITYTIDNAVLSSSGGIDYVEFDIMATSNSTGYIQNAPFFIEYSYPAFGTNVVTNSAITDTRGTSFGTTYEDPQITLFDSAANKFVTRLSDDFTQTSWSSIFVEVQVSTNNVKSIEVFKCVAKYFICQTYL